MSRTARIIRDHQTLARMQTQPWRPAGSVSGSSCRRSSGSLGSWTDSTVQTGVRVTGFSQRFLSEAERNSPGGRKFEQRFQAKRVKNSTAAGKVFISIQTKLTDYQWLKKHLLTSNDGCLNLKVVDQQIKFSPGGSQSVKNTVFFLRFSVEAKIIDLLNDFAAMFAAESRWEMEGKQRSRQRRTCVELKGTNLSEDTWMVTTLGDTKNLRQLNIRWA